MFSGNNPTQSNVIQFVTISTRKWYRFWRFTHNILRIGLAGNATRALYMGGSAVSAGDVNTIEFVTIATTGNAKDFGDLTQTPRSLMQHQVQHEWLDLVDSFLVY